jgi:aerobic carbon-monoxide dehydrogenase large subunit
MTEPSTKRGEAQIPLLAADRVRFVGEPIALIVADTPYRAEDAGDLVEVEYDPLPVVSDPQRSLDAAAPVLHEDWTDNEMLDVPYLFGDVDRAFEKADLIVREQLGMSRLAASPLECRQVLASFDKVSQQLTVTVASQTVHGYRFLLANVLSLPENHIRVIVPEVGGAFGNKGVYREEVAVCRAAMILGGTVKWVESRSENLIGSSHARDQFHEVELAVTNDGEILAMKDRILADMGAYWAIQGWDPMRYTIDLLTGPYRIRNCDFRVTCVATNKAPNGAFRGFGMEMGNFVIERMMDIVAARIGLDPVAIRRKNMISRADFPYVTPTGVFYEQNSFTECLDHLVREVDYAALRDWQGKLRQEGRSIGIGLSMHIESCAPDKQAPTMGLPGYESARVTIDPSGLVTVFSGLCPQGQGSETTLAQVAADELTVPIEDVVVVFGDSASCPPGFGTFGSRGAVMGGATVHGACHMLKRKVLQIAAKILDAERDSLELRSAEVRVRNEPARKVGLKDLAAISYLLPSFLPEAVGPTLDATYTFSPPNIRPINERGEGNISATYSNGANLAVVEVDTEVGTTRLLRFVAVHDCGNMINPMIVDGQIAGGVVSGLGNALLEQFRYDHDGQPLTRTFHDYLLPSPTDCPGIEIHHVVTPAPSIPGGFRGAREGGAIAAPAAIINAINDAMRHLGQAINTTPASPQALAGTAHQRRAESEIS